MGIAPVGFDRSIHTRAHLLVPALEAGPGETAGQGQFL